MTREPRYRCGLCLDSGIVTCWQTVYIKHFREVYDDEGYSVPDDWKSREEFTASGIRAFETCAVICVCDRATDMRAGVSRSKRVIFDEGRLCPYRFGDVAKLNVWLADRSDRFSEFDAFNEEGVV